MILNKGAKCHILNLYINDYKKEEKDDLSKNISCYNNMIYLNLLNLSFIRRRIEAYKSFMNFLEDYKDVVGEYKESEIGNHTKRYLSLIPSNLHIPYCVENVKESCRVSQSYNIKLSDNLGVEIASIPFFREFVSCPPIYITNNSIDFYICKDSSFVSHNEGVYLFLRRIIPALDLSKEDGETINRINSLVEKRDTDIFNFVVKVSSHWLSIRDKVLELRSDSNIVKYFPFLTPYVNKYTSGDILQ